MYVYVYIHTYKHTYIHTSTYTYIHTCTGIDDAATAQIDQITVPDPLEDATPQPTAFTELPREYEYACKYVCV